MNFKSKITFLLFISALLFTDYLSAQTPYIKQVVTGNSGKFEFVPPFTDYVTLQSYDPVTGVSTPMQTVFTQSVQDILIHGDFAYVAAQDSLIRIDLITGQRVAGIADSGLNRLLVFREWLIVSKQYPVSRFFAEVLKASDLSHVASINGIPGDCDGIASAGDSIYIAVNGGWMGTEGRIAVVETSGWTVARIIGLGPQAIGIGTLYHHGNRLISVNKSPFSAPGNGSISVYNLSDHASQNILLNRNIGNGAGIDNNRLYFGYNYGIGSFNLMTLQMEDTSVVADPGSSLFRYITSATVDSLNHRLYVNTGDYISPGYCLVTSLTGDSLTSYATGISTDAVEIHQRMAPAGTGWTGSASAGIRIYPNPACDFVEIRSGQENKITEIRMTNTLGEEVLNFIPGNPEPLIKLDIHRFHSGLYQLSMVTVNGKETRKLIIY